MKHALLFSLLPFFGMAQTPVGPNSPTVGTDAAGVGTTLWTNPNHITLSDNTYATVAASSATTHYLESTGYNFALVNTDVITGIRLEVEKSQVPNPVTLLSGWTIGNTGTGIVAGLNRCLIVSIGFENLVALDLTGVSFGGVPMTFLAESTVSGAFMGQTEVWYLMESQLAAISGTAITTTYSGVQNQHFDIIGSALFGNVDQGQTFVSTVTNAVTTAGATTLTPALTVTEGSMSVYNLFSGTPAAAASTMGPSNVNTITNSFVKQFEYNSYTTTTPGFTTSGGVFFVAQKSQAAAGTEAPVSNHSGGHNRRLIVAFNLRRAQNTDSNVRLRKAAGFIGNNYAQTTVDWPTTDTYAAYGGVNDMWGTTWTFSEINDANFGAGISALMRNNGTIRVDHVRITVFKTSVLPLELISFTASLRGNTIPVNWSTASELELKDFTVEKSTDGLLFNDLGTIAAAGNSTDLRNYEFIDERPHVGMNYLMLRMTDNDGTVRFSDIKAVDYKIDADFTIYPNPASEWVTVLSESGVDEIFIMDANGRIIDHVEGNSLNNSQELNIYDQPDGTYYICVKTGGETKVKQLTKLSK